MNFWDSFLLLFPTLFSDLFLNVPFVPFGCPRGSPLDPLGRFGWFWASFLEAFSCNRPLFCFFFSGLDFGSIFDGICLHFYMSGTTFSIGKQTVSWLFELFEKTWKINDFGDLFGILFASFWHTFHVFFGSNFGIDIWLCIFPTLGSLRSPFAVIWAISYQKGTPKVSQSNPPPYQKWSPKVDQKKT